MITFYSKKQMILYLDTETTGLYPGNICQLSYVMQDKTHVCAKNMFFSVDKVDYGAYLVHGFSAAKLKALSKGLRFADRFDEINDDFLASDVVVSHNTAFDFMFLRAEYERLGKLFNVKKEFCSMKKSVPVCKIPKNRGNGYKYPKLYELCENFGITESDVKEKTEELFRSGEAGFHDARFDTTAVFLAMNEGMKRNDVLSELEGYL